MRDSRSRRWAGAVALAVSVSMVPTMAVAGGSSASAGMAASVVGTGVAAAIPSAQNFALTLAKKKKKKKKKKKSASSGLTPESAETKRQAIRDAVASDVEKENWGAAATETENNAALLGDPVSYQQAAEYRLKQAEADRDIDAANAAIEAATVALDIYQFYDSVDTGESFSEWLVVSPAEAAGSFSEVEDIIERAEELIEQIEAEQEAGEDAGPADGEVKKKKKRKRGKAKPGTALIAIGSGLAAIGLGGAGAGLAGLIISRQKQQEVEMFTGVDQQAERDRLDEEGSRANLIGWIGLGVGAVGLGAGTALIVVGVIKRKKGGSPPESARLRVVPTMTARSGGLALHGRF